MNGFTPPFLGSKEDKCAVGSVSNVWCDVREFWELWKDVLEPLERVKVFVVAVVGGRSGMEFKCESKSKSKSKPTCVCPLD